MLAKSAVPGSVRLPRGWLDRYQRLVFLTDVVVVLGAVFVTQATTFTGSTRIAIGHGGHLTYWMLSSGLALAWIAALAVNGAWNRRIVGSATIECRRITQSSLYLLGFIAVLCLMAKIDISRGYLAMALPSGFLGLLGARSVLRGLLHVRRRAGSHMHSVVVVGGRQGAVRLASRLHSVPAFGYRVHGLCLPAAEAASAPRGSTVETFPVLGFLPDVLTAIRCSGADTVAVSASEHFGPQQVQELAWQLEGTGVSLFLAPTLTDVAGPRLLIKPVAGLPMMDVQEPLFRGPKLRIKAALDLCLALIGLILVAPLLVAVAVAIKLTDKGPVFFRHERVGRNGRSFRVWKFRTMAVDSESRIEEPEAGAGQSGQTFYKSVDDPRITKVGRVLRRSSIDELPQLLNVIAGQMSLVGPRPLVAGEGAAIGNFVERRMLIRPGMTGLWQVSGRSDVTAQERIRLDFYYVDNWSVPGDLVIIARTVRAVLARIGAY